MPVLEPTRRPLLRALLVALALAVVVWPLGSEQARGAGDNPNNVPGVPLPGPIVTGQLGGPIYDVVYRVDVPAGHVLLISMSGDTGTDFDLYLFDANATDIYTSQPIARSTGPTSTESITYDSIGGGTYYVDLSGFTDVEGSFRLVVQALADTVAPRVQLSLDGGAPATSDPSVRASIVATDDLSGVQTMEFSTDGAAWTPSQPYSPALIWTFTGPDGPRTLWVRVRDGAGNISNPVKATIVIDRVAPSVVSRSPDPGTTVAGLRPVFSVRFSEPINPDTWGNLGLIVQEAGGAVQFGSYTYDPATRTGSFQPAAPLQPGIPVIVTLAGVTDLAGNVIAPAGSWSVTPLLAPTISLASPQRVLPAAGPVTLTGTIDLQLGGTFLVEQSVAGGAFVPVSTVRPGAYGAFSISLRATANTSYRVHFLGTSEAAETVSPSVRVLVRRAVSLAAVDPSRTRTIALGQTVSLRASIVPADPAAAVTFQVFQYSATRHAYVRVASVARATVGGQATWSWHPARRGAYFVRVSTPPAPAYANAVSPIYRWYVR